MRVLVTGSDGYIASGVIDELLARGCEVVGWGLRESGREAPGYSERAADIFSATTDDLRAVGADALVHLAWRNGFRHADDSHVDDLPGHYHFLRRALEAGVPRVCVMGTMHEVGYHEGAVDADTPCRPTTPYGVAKNALRQLFLPMCEAAGAEGLWMRGFYLVSADGRGESIFSKIVRAAESGQRTFPFTSGRPKYDFLPYGRFCEIAADKVLSGETGVTNVCSGRPVSLAEEVESFIRNNGLDIRLEYGAYPDRPYDSPAIWGVTQERGYCQ